jgi:hypothetical protein
MNEVFSVGDHDFTKFGLIPSVILLVDIPSAIEDSFYTGQVLIGLKDPIYEASSPFRHATELHKVLLTRMNERHILFIYSDGGPDHRLTYVTVQLSLIALFLNLNLDVLVAGRTAPSHSWANPVERVISVVNLGLQCVGVMRAKMSDEFEKVISGCNNLKDLRAGCKGYEDGVRGALAPAKELLSNIFKRLELKGKSFEIFESATSQEIEEFWNILLSVDASINSTNVTKASLAKFKSLNQFISHCCTFRRYSITIKKCGDNLCSICKPVKMPQDVFSGMSCLCIAYMYK